MSTQEQRAAWRERIPTMKALARENQLNPAEHEAAVVAWEACRQEALDNYYRGLALYHYEEPVQAMEAEQEQATFELELIDMIATEIMVQTGELAGAIDINHIAREAADEILLRFELRRRS